MAEGDLFGRFERLVDAVLLAEAGEAAGGSERPYFDAVRQTFGPVFVEMGARMTDDAVAAAQANPSQAFLAVMLAAGSVAEEVVLDQVTHAVALALLLAQTLAKRAGVDTARVLRDCLEPLSNEGVGL